jgi:hypothetical protein
MIVLFIFVIITVKMMNKMLLELICVSVFYDSIRYVAIDDVSYREKRILWET